MPDIYSITLDTEYLHRLSGSLPWSVGRPIQGLEAPVIRVSAYDNPGSNGQTISNAYYGARVITLQGKVRGDTVEEYRGNRKLLASICSLNKDSDGNLVSQDLAITTNEGSYTIPVVVTKFQNPDEFPTVSSWQLELSATQSYWEGSGSHFVTITLPLPGGASFPWSFPLAFTGGGGGIGEIPNNGDVETPPIIYIRGPVINPRVANLYGEFIALNVTLLSGEEITIDCKKRTVMQGTTNRIGKLVSGSTFFTLRPTSSNYITFSADSYDTGTAQVFGTDGYGGI